MHQNYWGEKLSSWESFEWSLYSHGLVLGEKKRGEDIDHKIFVDGDILEIGGNNNKSCEWISQIMKYFAYEN